MQKQIELLIEKLKFRGDRISFAESCTGGLLSSRMVALPGVSSVYLGSIVAYDNFLKEKVLGVAPHLLNSVGAVSAPVALSMARGVKNLTCADWAVSITGIAGPGGGSPSKPVGTVWLGLVGPAIEQAWMRNFDGSREDIQNASCQFALETLHEHI